MRLLLLPVLGGLWGCCDDRCPADPEAPVIESLESGEKEVQVAASPASVPARSFQLHFWYRLSNGDRVSDYFGPMDLTFAPGSEGSATREGIQVNAFPNASAASVTATKRNDAGKTAQVALPRWGSPTDATARGGGADVVTVPHQPGSVPSVVVVEAQGPGGCANTPGELWERYAFVGAAAVGEHNAPCSIAVLSGTHRLLFQSPPDPTWSNPKALIDLASAMKEPLPLEITVFIAVTARTASILSGMELTDTDQLVDDVGAAAEAIAKVDVDLANIIFEANRVGIRVVAGKYEHLPVTPDLPAKVGADPVKCPVARDLALEAATASWITPAKISVYYVDRIYDEANPEDAGVRGLHCAAQGSTGPVLFISYTRHSSTALAHEIGHALSLKHPEQMTLDHDKMLRSTNLMSVAAMDGPLAADVRSRLTLGQVFRMNVAVDSWLNNAQGPRYGFASRTCAIGGQCPPQDVDVY